MLREIVQSEETYYEGLLCLWHCFILPIQAYYETQRLTPPTEWSDFKSVTTQMVHVHGQTMMLLADQVYTHNAVGKAGDISWTFVNLCMSTLQELYPRYLNRQTAVGKLYDADKQLQAHLQAGSHTVRDVVGIDGRTHHLDPNGMSFRSYVIQPMQRVAGYALLLNRLVSLTQKDHSHIGTLMGAASSVQAVANRMDQIMKDYQAIEKMQEMFCSTHEDFKVEGRQLLQKGQLTLCGSKETPCYIYLLSDLLLITLELSAEDAALRDSYAVNKQIIVHRISLKA